MFQFKKDLIDSNFFRFDKVLIKQKRWAALPLASKSIYPVIAVHCDEGGVAFPSEQTIAIKCGCTRKTVGKGLKGLRGLPGLDIGKYTTGRGHKAYKYNIRPTPEEKGRSFPFRKIIVDGGNWSQLIPSAQALYPVIRTFAFFDFEYFLEVGPDYEGEENEFFTDGYYRHRGFDFFYGDIDEMAKYAGIGKRTAHNAIQSLEDKNLLRNTMSIDGYKTWKVFIDPPKIYRHEWLNDQVNKRYKNDVNAKFTH